jgi:hypothetical protein
VQSIDLLITGIDWLITIDSTRRIIRDAAIAVDQGKIVAVDKSAEIAKFYSGRQTTMAAAPSPRAWLHRLPPAFLVPASRGLADEANAQLRSCSTACTLRGRARERRRAHLRDAGCR